MPDNTMIDKAKDFAVDIIDTWNMTITSAGTHRGITKIDLPGNQYMAIRVRRANA